jgi:serine/threonine-protein kinase
MPVSRTITEPPRPPRRDQPNGEPARRPLAGQFRVALAPRTAAQATRDLEEQLRKRLRVGAILVAAYHIAFVGIGLPFDFPRLLAAPLEAFTRPPFIGVALLIACLEGIIAARLSPRHSTDLTRLRVVEWLALAPVLAYSVWQQVYFLAGSLAEVGKNPYLFADALGAAWALMLVAYGVVIPNTWRRCALMVTLIALVGFVPDVFVVLGNRISSQPAFVYLTNKALWLGVAGAITVLGSYRIEVLRQEAVQARRLGQYVLRDRLGAGGMGEVYLAEHLLLRRPCALKLIRPERAGDPKLLLRFEREVRTTATLTHPNTVQIFDYGHAEDGTFYYVMEYLPGLTLDQLVKRCGPLPAARAVHLLRQVCAALREAHAVGLIHRDIKPGNVMICERGGLHDVAKLLDFGLVLPQGAGPDGERLTQEGVITGTPAYMSPEQAAGREDVDARSDIYSVGCLAYSLLTGRPPFAARAAVGMLAAHMYEPPAPLVGQRPDVTEELQAVVLRCLAKDPGERFASANELDAALAGCPAAGRWTEEDAAAWWRANHD